MGRTALHPCCTSIYGYTLCTRCSASDCSAVVQLLLVWSPMGFGSGTHIFACGVLGLPDVKPVPTDGASSARRRIRAARPHKPSHQGAQPQSARGVQHERMRGRHACCGVVSGRGECVGSVHASLGECVGSVHGSLPTSCALGHSRDPSKRISCTQSPAKRECICQKLKGTQLQ